jgi:asparaginyl-tRNA synthetase
MVILTFILLFGLLSIIAAGEKELIKRYGDFTWITNMPNRSVPFYQTKEPGTDFSMTGDLLAGIGEILGCGQRVFTAEDTKNSLAEHEVSEDGYKWYIEMRDIKTIKTSGFGLGMERFMLWVLKHNDVRDCALLIRDHSKVIFP